MDISVPMIGLTWVTFLLMAWVLYKIAWKPILAGLAARENGIRQALEDAEKARREAAATEERCLALVTQAKTEADQLVEEARKAAREVADGIETEAHHQTREMLDQAHGEIERATEKARESLRRETADLATRMAAKILRRSIDAATQSEVVREMTEEL
jgi:F-type H+-transporting ATPase subunit b